MRNLTLLILAAGKGTRLKSNLPKVLHRLAGKPLIEYVVEAARPLGPSATCVVVGYEAGQVQRALSHLPLQFAVQEPQLGTGHAVQIASSFWQPNRGNLLVLSGDVPLISTETLQQMLCEHTQSAASATLLSTKLDNPARYGRVVRGPRGDVERIVEHKDATAEELRLDEINTGIYCFAVSDLAQVVGQLSAENSQREYYLTDCIGLLKKQNKRVSAVICKDPVEVGGMNSRVELAELERIVRQKKLEQLMLDGVTVIDPASTYVEPGVQVGADTVLYPNVFLEKASVIGARCQIYPNVRISASTLEDGVVVLDSCLISESRVRTGSQVGPFAHLKNHTVVGRQARIGNFVEIKNSQIGDNTKAAHLSYLGDAEIGQDVNVGAGTITCNYDGFTKSKTIVEDGVFVGSDSQLIAPVTVHRGAYIAAGSTIEQDVPEEALAIARSHQVNKEHWARKKRESRRKD
ncbi:MAG: bifunctional UDP-N-acetylglucosamine diphosphorylase/glucosamine-1-phosphate N-acetyltransferase GlmU [Acidobacteria bacterium]|nr:bifunctional UDP-N-acetylglucosamine diphosphorylase/glucosamine-1-phosphate N-acetyltransferase GlmU [Acidobacteriota bacterium]MCI0721099.1 bifunctional UDP-N-acetylglucosamine diphosphorylase/glucosamine-1-phosphate N-acetyltransferase GlmU [Acidobacteriota bacterium]